MTHAGRAITGALFLVVTLGVLSFLWGTIGLDASYREALYQSGEQKALIDEFRQYYYRRPAYETMSLSHLREKGILSDHCFDYISSEMFSYRPFSPETSEDEVVLRLGLPIIGEYIYKRDLIADPQGPDRIEKK